MPRRGGPPWIRALGPLVLADLRHRYAGSPLGAVWALLVPLIEVMAYVLLFGLIVRPGLGHEGISMALFLASGILPWASLREGLEGSAAVLGENRWIKRSAVPVELLVARQVAAAVPRTALGFALILLVALPAGMSFGPGWALPLLALALQTASVYGLGLGLAPLAALHPDLRPILTSSLTLLTFASPILYPETILGPAARGLLAWNPFTHLLRLYRVPLDGRAILTAVDVAAALATPLVCWAIGAGIKGRFWWPARDRL
jgi:ABC-2 type transport system permease protein